MLTSTASMSKSRSHSRGRPRGRPPGPKKATSSSNASPQSSLPPSTVPSASTSRAPSSLGNFPEESEHEARLDAFLRGGPRALGLQSAPSIGPAADPFHDRRALKDALAPAVRNNTAALIWHKFATVPTVDVWRTIESLVCISYFVHL